jgi:hypothetical protein
LDYSNIWTATHAWGEGASSGAYLEATNSIFKSVGNGFYCHASNNMTTPYIHVLKNCELLSENKFSISIDDNTSPINNNTLIVENCYLNNRISIIGGANKYNMLISGSSIVPIYQKPEHVLVESDFPIYTEIIKEYITNEAISKGNFVYSLDGKTIQKADSTTNHKLIVGYAIGNHATGDKVKVMRKYLQPISQTWPESDSLVHGKYYKIGDNANLIETNNIEEAIALSSERFYKLFI